MGQGRPRRVPQQGPRLVAEADIIVGHNVDNADVPWLQGDFYLPRIGHPHRPNLKPLPPRKTVDTLKVLRREFKSGAPFKGLDAFCQIVGIPAKTDAYDRDAMERAVAGSVEDRERLTDYCEGDVIATQCLYDWARPHIKNHPAPVRRRAGQAHDVQQVRPRDEGHAATLRRERPHVLDAQVPELWRLLPALDRA